MFCFCFFLPQKPERDEWVNGLDAMEHALQLEKTVNQALLDLHKLASEHGDPHVRCCFKISVKCFDTKQEFQLSRCVFTKCNFLVPQMCDFLETHYLNEQVEAIKKLGDYITNLKRLDPANNKMAEYLFDKHTLDGGKS